MKKLYLLLILLITNSIYGQRDIGNIQLRIELGLKADSNGNITELISDWVRVYSSDRDACIIGAFEVVNPTLIWHSSIFPNKEFLTRNNEFNLYNAENEKKEVNERTLTALMSRLDSTSSWPTDNRSMVFFSFVPLKESMKADSVKFLFKYVYYQPTEKKSLLEFKYDVKYGISFCNIAYEQLTNFSLLEEVLPKIDIKIKAHYIDIEEKQKLENKEEIKYVDISYYKNSIKQIEESVKKSKIDARQIKFSLEYVRTDKKNEQLILNKLFFPLIGANTAIMDVEYMKFPSFIYRGTLNSPLEFYEKDKNELLQQSAKWRFHKFTYDVLVIPLEKKGEELLCDVYFPSSTLIPLTNCYKKSISFKVGERVKIALPEGHWYISDLIGDKSVIITDKSFRDYVNEYFVLFVESLGEISNIDNRDKSQANRQDENNETKSVENRTYAENQRISLGNELYVLAKEAVNYSYSRNRSLRSWEIPATSRKYGFNIYRVTDIDNGIEIEAVGRAIGNDKVTPVRSVIKVTSQRKSTTHYVKSGESVSTIAKKYGVSVQQIKLRNNLKSNRFSVGQKLIIDEPSSRNNLVISQVEVKN